jgi:hypothetical protein
MTRRSLIPLLLLGVACSGRSAEPPAASPTPPPTTVAAAPSPMGPAFEAEVVTMDAAAPSVTLRHGDVPATNAPRAKDLKAGDRTIRVEPSAAGSLSALKPGMRVRVTCSASASVITQGPGAAGSASPAIGPASPATGAASSTIGAASPATGVASSTMGAASPAAGMGASPASGGPLAQCDSIVVIASLEAAPAP